MDAVRRQEESLVGGQEDACVELVSDVLQVSFLVGRAVELSFVDDATWDIGCNDDRHALQGFSVGVVVTRSLFVGDIAAVYVGAGPSLGDTGLDDLFIDGHVSFVGLDAGLLAEACYDVVVVLESIRHDGVVWVELVHAHLSVLKLG